MEANSIDEIIEILGRSKKDMLEARQRGAGYVTARERYKNLLYAYADKLIGLKDEITKLREENDVLGVEISDADKESDRLRARVQELEEQLAAQEEKPRRKAKARAPETPEIMGEE